LEVTAIHSIAGTLLPGAPLVTRPTFEAPHHSATLASLVGGGSGQIRPGALCRAHRGVLFLDESSDTEPYPSRGSSRPGPLDPRSVASCTVTWRVKSCIRRPMTVECSRPGRRGSCAPGHSPERYRRARPVPTRWPRADASQAMTVKT